MRLIFSMLILVVVFGSINAQSKTLPSFSTISTSGNVQVELIKGSQTKAEYTISKGTAEDLVLEVKGSQLTVKIKSKISGMWNRSETRAKVKVYYQTLFWNRLFCRVKHIFYRRNKCANNRYRCF